MEHEEAHDMTEDTQPRYTKTQEATIAQLEADLAAHMRDVRPKRYEHSLSVAKTAESMAMTYGTDPFPARCAGILHDWDKVLSADEQVRHAIELGVDMGVDIELVQPLLHGLTAALTLPARYPTLPSEIFRAISLHTVGSADMTALDEILFVADGIEPLRKPAPAIEHVRDMVARGENLDEVYVSMFSSGIEYVVGTRRYLYPGTIDVYNELVLKRGA